MRAKSVVWPVTTQSVDGWRWTDKKVRNDTEQRLTCSSSLIEYAHFIRACTSGSVPNVRTYVETMSLLKCNTCIHMFTVHVAIFNEIFDDGIICRVPYSISNKINAGVCVCAAKQLKHAIKILFAFAFSANAHKHSRQSVDARASTLFGSARFNSMSPCPSIIHWLIICASLHFYLTARTISFLWNTREKC